jgi:hypothetical protein
LLGQLRKEERAEAFKVLKEMRRVKQETLITAKLQGVISEKAIMLVFTLSRISDLTRYVFLANGFIIFDQEKYKFFKSTIF